MSGKTEIEIVDIGEKRYALLPLSLLERMQDLRDLEDEILAAIGAREQAVDAATVPGEVVHRIVLEDVHPLRAWREYRGLTQEALARRAGTSKAYISQIERRQRQPGLALARALAAALQAPLDVLVEQLAGDDTEMGNAASGDDAA